MSVSVVIPIYNVERYLLACTISVTSQTYAQLQTLLLDDGSEDNSALQADEYLLCDMRFICVHKKNGGLSDARNAGIELSFHDYLSFIDSDDIVSIDFIGTFMDIVKDTSATLIAAELACFNDGELPSITSIEQPILKYNCYTAHDALENPDSKRGLWAHIWNKLIHKKLFDEIRFPVGKLHEDEYVSYKLYHKAKELIYIDKVVYFYRQRPSSIMGQISIRHIDSLEAFYNRAIFIREHYASLYPKEMISFCISCWNLYVNYYSNPRLFSEAKKRILELRRKVTIPYHLFASCSWKSKYYILRSHPALMHLVCMLLGRLKK